MIMVIIVKIFNIIYSHVHQIITVFTSLNNINKSNEVKIIFRKMYTLREHLRVNVSQLISLTYGCTPFDLLTIGLHLRPGMPHIRRDDKTGLLNISIQNFQKIMTLIILGKYAFSNTIELQASQ